MANEAMTECEQCGVGVLNLGLHDRWHRGQSEPAAVASAPTAASLPPLWWRQMVAAHDVKQAQEQNSSNFR